MATLGPRLAFIAAGFSAVLFAAAALAEPAQIDPVAASRLVATLHDRGLVKPTLQSQIQAVADVLVEADGHWPRANVNGPFDPSALNIYLVDAESGAALNDPVLADVGRARGTLRSLPGLEVILVDINYLAQVKAGEDLETASIGGHRLVTHFDAFVVPLVEGPDEAERSRLGDSADWRQGTNLLFDGAAAFLIAHEMGHMVAGLDPSLERSFLRPRGLEGRDRDRARACSNLVGETVQGMRRQEAEADHYAAQLLGRIAHPSIPNKLRFDVGALSFLTAELGKTATTVILLSPNATKVMALAGNVIDESLARKMMELEGQNSGFIETVFPASHPARVERLLSVSDEFERNPMSLSYGNPDPGYKRMWPMLIQQMCRSIAHEQ